MAKELDIKKLLKDQTEKLTEVFNDKMKIVEDGFKGINQKLDSHEEQIGNILVDLSTVKLKVSEINYKLTVDLERKIDKKHFYRILNLN